MVASTMDKVAMVTMDNAGGRRRRLQLGFKFSQYGNLISNVKNQKFWVLQNFQSGNLRNPFSCRLSCKYAMKEGPFFLTKYGNNCLATHLNEQKSDDFQYDFKKKKNGYQN